MNCKQLTLFSQHSLQECPAMVFSPQSPSKSVMDLLNFICRCMFVEEKHLKLIHHRPSGPRAEISGFRFNTSLF